MLENSHKNNYIIKNKNYFVHEIVAHILVFVYRRKKINIQKKKSLHFSNES